MRSSSRAANSRTVSDLSDDPSFRQTITGAALGKLNSEAKARLNAELKQLSAQNDVSFDVVDGYENAYVHKFTLLHSCIVCNFVIERVRYGGLTYVKPPLSFILQAFFISYWYTIAHYLHCYGMTFRCVLAYCWTSKERIAS